MNPQTICAGGPCSCSPGRVVRWAVPRVPGLLGEVSCRSIGETRWADVRHHELPRNTDVVVKVGDVMTGSVAK